MRTLLRIGAAIAVVMALAVAIVVIVLVQRENVIAADPRPSSSLYIEEARTALPTPFPTDETQIVLRVRLVEIDHEKLAELGIGLGTFTQEESKSLPHFGQLASLNSGTADLFISSLRANGVAKTLAEPTIVAAEGRPASFHNGGEFPILVPQSAGTTAVEFREFGTSIDFTANKQPSGNLRLEMCVTQAEIDASRTVTIDGNQVPGLRTRSIDTAFEVQLGHTAMFYGEEGDGLLIMVTPELVEPAASTTQVAAAPPEPLPTAHPRRTRTRSSSGTNPASAVRPLPSPPLPATAEQPLIAMTALVYRVDSESLRENGIDLGEAFSLPATNGDGKRTPSAIVDARKLASLTRRLSEATSAEVLSRPQLLAMSGNSARVEAGRGVRIPRRNSAPSVSDEEYAVDISVDLVPVALGEGQIRLDATVKRSFVEDETALRWITLSGNADLFTGETLVVYEEGYDVLLLVTPRLLPSELEGTPTPTRQLPSDFTPAKSLPGDNTLGSREPTERSLAAAKVEAESKLQALTEHFGPQHPNVVEQWGKIASIAEYRAKLQAKRSEQERQEERQRHQERRIRAVNEFEQISQGLFPGINVDLREVGSGVVLSGRINDKEQVRVLAAIAKDLFPNVINNLRTTDTSAVSISEGLHELREDVHVLRRDVSRLIDILEDRDSSSLKTVPPEDDQSSNTSADEDGIVWQLIGIRVEQAVVQSDTYRGGLKIVEVRPESPAAKEGFQQGDILVGLDNWETINRANLHFIAGQIDEGKPEPLRFHVLRASHTLSGHMKLAIQTEEAKVYTIWDVTLDEVISIGLQNSKAIRDLGGVTPFEFDGTKTVVLSRVNKDVSLANFETAVRNYVSDTEGAYWELWAAQRDLDTTKQSRDAAQVLWNQINERMRGGIVDAQAEAQAREQYFYFRAQLQSALKELYSCEEKLRFLIGLASSDGRKMRAADEPTIDKYTLNWDDAKKNALSNSVALRRQRQVVRQAELELTGRKKSLQPRGDLAGLFTWNNGLAGEGITDEDLAAKYGLEFQLPAGFRQEAAAVKDSELKVARAKAVLEEMEKNAVQLLTQSMRDADIFYQSAQTHFIRRKAATAEVESTTSLYRSGKTTLDLVLDAQRRLSQSKTDYTSALAQYVTAIKDVRFLKGTLLAEHKLAIDIAEEPVPASQETDAALVPRSPAIPDPTVKLESGDRLTIDSLTDDSLNRHVSILPDGTITLPLLGQVTAAGETLTRLQDVLHELYRKSYSNPAISVSFYGTSVRIDDTNPSDSALTQLENIRDPTSNLKPGDQLLMESFVDSILNRRLTILGDGSVTLPLLGQIQAAGHTLQELTELLGEAYKDHYKQPSLTLSFAGTSLPARN
ncbi:MAG: polysaccharide biosynthesis/export family protein [Planctomycetes bacterium]|nr:polysaccharide biosynthesis/export family protein [Planctomycetota bacterium]